MTNDSSLGRASLPRAIGDRLFWGATFKYRKILIPVLVLLILLATGFALKSYYQMQSSLQRLSAYEPIYVLGLNRDLNVGDVIKSSDLKAVLFYKNEYERDSELDETGLAQNSLLECKLDSQDQIYGQQDIVGRVLKVPVFKNSILRKDYLAEPGAVPGIASLIEKHHSIIDIAVPQTGFNVFIKPNDEVDLYETTKTGARLLASKMKVVLVDSLPLGKAPFQVAVKARELRNLSISVPDRVFAQVMRAKRAKNLLATYNHGEEKVIAVNPQRPLPKPKDFQALTFIQGDKKELIKE